jgi:hypothetical protein
LGRPPLTPLRLPNALMPVVTRLTENSPRALTADA